MINIESLILIIPITCGLIASYTDIKERKIRNKVTYPLILAGIMVQIISYGTKGLVSAFIGILICFILMLLIPGTKHSVGDIKLSMGFGAFLGIKSTYYIIISLALFTIFNIASIIKNYGIRDLILRLKVEILSLGKATAEADKRAGAPILLIGFVVTLLTIYRG